MDSKTSFAILTAQTTLFLVLAIVTVDGAGLVVLKKPFFSSNLREREASKNIPVIGATEEVTSATNSKASISIPSKNGERTFSCTSQKGGNTTKDTPVPITLHETPTINTSPALSPSSSVQSPAVASSAVYVARPTLRTETANFQGSDHCPSGYTKQLNGSCYKFVDSSTGANRSVAQSECKGLTSHLVFIETKEEHNFLIGGARSNTEYWIGIHERPNLFWDNGNQVTFANIDPDNSYTFDNGTGCYVMSDSDERSWLDKQCSEHYSYICEYEGTDCPSNYAITNNASCYKFGSFGPKTNRSEARSACKTDSAHLVFIETKEENDFLVRQAGSSTQYWIGIHERPNLFWDNGNQVTYANIDPDNSYTFNGGTGCYVMSDNDERNWLEKQCSENYNYICEYEGDGCPSEYNITHGSSCYKFFDTGSRTTRSDAQSACKRDSSHLVFIETKEENDFLVREAGSNNEYWIGIHERPNLFWDDGNQVTYAYIDPYGRYTFNDGTGCYRMYKNDNGWHDAQCTRRCHYICEHEGDECPEDYTSNHSASCYKFANSTDSKATLSEARSACKNDSSHLVFIETKEENDFLIREATSGYEYWIGIHKRPHLFWDNGNQVTFANIDPDDMDTLSERNGCYRMCYGAKRYWSKSSCSNNYGYICEYDED